MTAIHVFRVPEGAVMLADGAVYDHDGILQAAIEKVLIAECRRFMLAFSSDDTLRDIGWLTVLTTLGSTEDVLSEIEARLAECRLKSGPGREAFDRHALTLILAGILQTGEFRLWCAVFGPEDLHMGMKAYRLNAIDLPDYGTGATVPLPDLQNLMTGVSEITVDVLRERGGEFLELQRRQRIRAPGGGAGTIHGIGCHVDMAVLTSAGVSIERLRNWPDRIGSPIRP